MTIIYPGHLHNTNTQTKCVHKEIFIFRCFKSHFPESPKLANNANVCYGIDI